MPYALRCLLHHARLPLRDRTIDDAHTKANVENVTTARAEPLSMRLVAAFLSPRKQMMLGAAIVLIGAMIAACAADDSWGATTGIVILLYGRVLFGLGCGFFVLSVAGSMWSETTKRWWRPRAVIRLWRRRRRWRR